uniref:V-type proton ATPase subunit S1/VOA1 transmembrane domain-containing protein n=2 Tax=Rhodnius prolixus TaxID=13249 RepID=T1HAB1_RHOPR
MSVVYKQSVLFILFLSIIGSVLSGVPVLLWEASSTSDKQDVIPALYQLDSDEFSNHIIKKIHVHNPLIALFLEETLSMEDFSWQDVQQQGSFSQLRNLTKMAAKTEFIPSVENPLDAMKSLVVSNNYLWKKYDRNNLPTKGGVLLEVKMKDPLSNEDRPALLRRHDANIAEIYSQLLAKHSSIIAIFTGKQSSWMEFESNRVRREAEEKNNSSTSSSPASLNILKGNISDKNYVIDPFDNPVITVGNETITLTSPDCCKMDDRTNYTRLISSYKYNDGSKLMKLRFRFEKEENRWKLAFVEFEDGAVKEELYPEADISAPIGKSFKTTSPVVFRSKDEKDVELRFGGLQAQAFMTGVEFGETAKAKTVFFTPGIWSGLIVTFILGLILTWGIVMLMDIRTMDRFDDPKGKTIQAGGAD